jgi:CRISPR-associated Cas5-like protein
VKFPLAWRDEGPAGGPRGNLDEEATVLQWVGSPGRTPVQTSLLEVKVWGPFACFTRPEMKVERVSYTVMTPSAARGILEAIFWKPEFA